MTYAPRLEECMAHQLRQVIQRRRRLTVAQRSGSQAARDRCARDLILAETILGRLQAQAAQDGPANDTGAAA